MPTKNSTKKAVVKKPVKKVSTKKAVKKAPAKTVAKKAPAKKAQKQPLVYADNSTSFWVTNGAVLNSLVALKEALDEMEKDVYQYHAGKEQNDFAVWVESVLCDAECAKGLQKAKTPSSAKTIVAKHLKQYAI